MMVNNYNALVVSWISVMCLVPLAWADCPEGTPIRLTLTAAEFEIPGYDAQKGLLAIRPSRDLAPTHLRKRAVRLLLKGRDILLSVGPASLRYGLERAGQLELHLEGEPARPKNRLGMKPDCGRLMIRAASLRYDGLVLAQRRLDEVPARPVKISSTVQLERGRLEQAALLSEVRLIAEQCLGRRTLRGRQIRGALSIQLETSILGQPQRPKVVVDGLVNLEVSSCLVMSIHESEAVWKRIKPATRAYLNYFFRTP